MQNIPHFSSPSNLKPVSFVTIRADWTIPEIACIFTVVVFIVLCLFSIYFDLLYCSNWTSTSVRTTSMLKSNLKKKKSILKSSFACPSRKIAVRKNTVYWNLINTIEIKNWGWENIFNKVFFYKKIVNFFRKRKL